MMTIKQLFSILLARKILLLSIAAVVVLLGLTLVFVLPKQYTATAAVVIDSKSPDPISGMVMQGVLMPSYVATQIDVIMSERVAQKAIRYLRLEDSPQMRAQWEEATEGQGVFESWLSDLFLKNLDIKPSRESSVINVSYTAADPRFASAVVNAFVQGYIDTTLELRVEPARQFSRMFDEQAKQARDKLEKARAALSAYQKKNGIIATDERFDVETNRLNELSAQLVALQTQTADATSRASKAGSDTSEVLSSMVVAGLRTDISRQEAKLKELSATLGASHPQVVQLQASIAELKARLVYETGSVNSSVRTTSAVNQQREAQVRAALEAQREKLLKLKEQRDEAGVLYSDVDNAQKSYDLVAMRLNQTALEGQSNQTNVGVLKVASPPPSHSSPKFLIFLVVSIFLGVLLALGVTLLIEFFDRRIRVDDDLLQIAGNELLGHMPPSLTKAGKRRILPASNIPKISNRALPELIGSK
ncbi:chain length determinant protein EpsF [Aquabacterium soli]|uniref:Chain length determinant protein EpsF n=1 Tax=Aquabacterium soli TaxID=2493092 RepID=A0A3R8SYD0_9BURK|nr:chain length determinant protein EpsF [Aquabacterium soli]RRR99919.1 chain length determinant protein EpsF [Aquabacterium soli]